MLELADCYFFNLKKVKFDPIASMQNYALAADLFQPEAMNYMAINAYKLLITPFYNSPQNHEFPPIPAEMKRFINQESNEKLWYWLGKIAIMDWISPIFVSQVQQAEKLGTWKLSNTIKDTMKRRQSGEILKLKMKHLIPCSSAFCIIHMEDLNLFQICERCLKEKYCSKDC